MIECTISEAVRENLPMLESWLASAWIKPVAAGAATVQTAKVLMAASPTFQEAFMTSVRVRLAERRGREFLEKALAAKRGEIAEEPVAPVDFGGMGH